jgi:hypothetical protein
VAIPHAADFETLSPPKQKPGVKTCLWKIPVEYRLPWDGLELARAF